MKIKRRNKRRRRRKEHGRKKKEHGWNHYLICTYELLEICLPKIKKKIRKEKRSCSSRERTDSNQGTCRTFWETEFCNKKPLRVIK